MRTHIHIAVALYHSSSIFFTALYVYMKSNGNIFILAFGLDLVAFGIYLHAVYLIFSKNYYISLLHSGTCTVIL